MQNIDERYENALTLATQGRPSQRATGVAISTVSQLLNRKLRVSISDNRQFIGFFMCTDKHLNLLLSATEEHRDGEPLPCPGLSTDDGMPSHAVLASLPESPC